MVKRNRVMRKKSTRHAPPLGWQPTYLKGSFMVTAILGLFISVYYVYPINFNYGVTFILIFLLMFIAAFISMTKAPFPEREVQ